MTTTPYRVGPQTGTAVLRRDGTIMLFPDDGGLAYKATGKLADELYDKFQREEFPDSDDDSIPF